MLAAGRRHFDRATSDRARLACTTAATACPTPLKARWDFLSTDLRERRGRDSNPR
jgi:hypothetical protein